MKASAVVPAYNEEKTIAGVIEPLLKAPCLGEVIVVSDGSTDSTAEVALRAGAQVVELKDNLGKGGAMIEGVGRTVYPVILFVDADLIGLTPDHVQDLVLPVLHDEADMTVGIFGKGRRATDLAQQIAPFLSGQRAVKRQVLERISNLEASRFGIEVVLTRYVYEQNLRVRDVLLPDLSHLMKEEKLGLLKGFSARMRMYWEIAKCASGR